jgi:hypothetical protein
MGGRQTLRDYIPAAAIGRKAMQAENMLSPALSDSQLNFNAVSLGPFHGPIRHHCPSCDMASVVSQEYFTIFAKVQKPSIRCCITQAARRACYFLKGDMRMVYP